VALSRKQEKKRKHDNLYQHHLTEIAACKALSKRVKETAVSHKARVKEQALETSTQQIQTMHKTYQGTNSGQFPNGRTNLENVSNCTANWTCLLKTANSPSFFLLPWLQTDFHEPWFGNKDAIWCHGWASCCRCCCNNTQNQQTAMTQHYGVRSKRQSLPSGLIELTDAASKRPCFFHHLTSRMVLTKADIFLKRPWRPCLAASPRMSLPATVGSHAREPNQAVSAPSFSPTMMVAAQHGTQEEPLELSSLSSLLSVTSSVSRKLSILQAQTMGRTSSIQPDKEGSEATSCLGIQCKDEEQTSTYCMDVLLKKKRNKKD
jgi:hypothetical protein